MRFIAPLAAALLVACASNDKQPLQGAVATPFNDLNLANAPIPDVLSSAQKAPYALPEAATCLTLHSAVLSLDEVLGPDLDAPATESDPGLIERGGNVVAGAVQNAAEGLIPYRGWVRKLSGAERHSRHVAAAIAAGTHRRAFLKGVSKGKDCGAV